MPVLNSIADSAEQIATWRRHIHQNPEIGLHCVKTAAFVAERLREIGADEIHESIGRTGIVALIKGRGDGPVLGLRADMDALPMPETTGKEYASRVEGAMHACGHDGHTAMLLGAAKYLAGTRNFAGTVALIFQPAEETGEGAKAMLAEGIMDRFDIERVFGIHTSPMHDLGQFTTRTGPLMAAVGDFDILIKGRGGHGAYPQRAADPVAAALVMGNALQTIVSRNVDASDEVVLSITNIHAGSAFNVIPAEARLGGTIRSFSTEARDLVRRRMREICEGVAAAMGCTVEIRSTIDIDPTVNHEAETALAIEVAKAVSGCEIAPHPHMGGEDFGAMLGERPGAFLFLGQGKGPMVHETDFDFNDAAAPIGASFFAKLVERALPLT
ncbi:amidohydrolase [Defluviimonas sp. 20V17]|uniref:Amidohydrolase n=1 Tax=Allgaiera indica TaxID=765699 RepID=A0AAN4UNQ6_9RHOB|nr:M20 aminoacylase family protein [Allgaiera indica]KDB04017.1 amidohydrolase [Defluviimonas sp. 20V17]GHD99322.1 amidohydrolase [Allgaiera indica]SDW28826.1 hippurate hydrolase [Allgaiera indica]